MESSARVALVTGASSGFGRAIATLLAKNGFRVFGTSRKPEGAGSDGYPMVRLDVTSDESVRECVRSVLDQAGRLDLVVNNRGLCPLGGRRRDLHRGGEGAVRDELLRCHAGDAGSPSR